MNLLHTINLRTKTVWKLKKKITEGETSEVRAILAVGVYNFLFYSSCCPLYKPTPYFLCQTNN